MAAEKPALRGPPTAPPALRAPPLRPPAPALHGLCPRVPRGAGLRGGPSRPWPRPPARPRRGAGGGHPGGGCGGPHGGPSGAGGAPGAPRLPAHRRPHHPLLLLAHRRRRHRQGRAGAHGGGAGGHRLGRDRLAGGTELLLHQPGRGHRRHRALHHPHRRHHHCRPAPRQRLGAVATGPQRPPGDPLPRPSLRHRPGDARDHLAMAFGIAMATLGILATP